MRVAIIDADLIGRKKHRFPNLVCMKLSAYHKIGGADVFLKTDYDHLELFDKVFISKVFTDTPIDDTILNLENVQYGGTGFFYDTAPKLPDEIEHIYPDYHLYDEWVAQQIQNGVKPIELKYYTDYSIGFMTRGCFRQCQFCVNRNYKQVTPHSPLEEFHDVTRPKICLLDDNFFGLSCWRDLLKELQSTNKPFQFKQGLDERLLTDKKCQMLFKSKYDGDYIFAFDNIDDAELIECKLQMIRQYTNKRVKFYVFCGFDRNDNWDYDFWKQDILDLMARIEILMKYHALPYIMRFMRYKESQYESLYNNIARWCNQPAFFTKKSFHEFAKIREGGIGWRTMLKAESEIDSLIKYFDMKWKE